MLLLSYPEEPGFLGWVVPLKVLEPLDAGLMIWATIWAENTVIEDDWLVVLMALDITPILAMLYHLLFVRWKELVAPKTAECLWLVFDTKLMTEAENNQINNLGLPYM